MAIPWWYAAIARLMWRWKGVEMASLGAGAGNMILCGRGCGVDDGGHALITNVSFHLVVNVGVSARRWWVPRAGSRDKLDS